MSPRESASPSVKPADAGITCHDNGRICVSGYDITPDVVINCNEGAVEYIKNTGMNYLRALGMSDTEFVPDSLMPCGKGATFMRGIEHMHYADKIHIGCHEISYGVSHDAFNRMYIFRSVKSMFHELRHLWQEYMEKYDISDMAYKMSVFWVCRIADERYYKRNYYNNLKEFDAEFDALSKTRHVLSHQWGEGIADELLCKFVGGLQGRYYISVPELCSADDIFSAFADKAEYGCSMPRRFDFIEDANLINKMSAESDGFKQDEIFARDFLSKDLELSRVLTDCTPSLCKIS